jgi:hypothetical protein
LTENSTSVRPGKGPTQIESPGALAITTERGGATATVTDHGAKSDARLSVVLSVSALVLSLLLTLFCWGLWSRVDLLRIFYDDLKTGLVQLGGNPHPHLPSESP